MTKEVDSDLKTLSCPYIIHLTTYNAEVQEEMLIKLMTGLRELLMLWLRMVLRE